MFMLGFCSLQGLLVKMRFNIVELAGEAGFF